MRTILGNDRDPDTMVLAHRGWWGRFARTADLPENSHWAIDAASVNCADGIELDVKMTRNGEPVLMHDFNLGRTTNIWQVARGDKYDPIRNVGQNPAVSSLDSSVIGQLFLLTPDRSRLTRERVPRVDDVLRKWVEGIAGTYAPLVFDIKTTDAVRAVDAHVHQRMAGYGKTIVAAKVNATLYPTPGAFFRDSSNMSPIPVFTTNMLGVTNVAESVLGWSMQVNTLEINMKQPRGLLSPEVANSLASGDRVGVFQAIPDGPRLGEFYKNTGACCYKLSDLYYTYRFPGGTSRDTADLRGDLNYITQQRFGLITTDDPDTAVRFLDRKGLRQRHPKGYFITPTTPR
ncbi:glycerophosphodiester phosphodiesterase family protein [Sphingomonas corticis]|jgi:hypothetical protein|uniref:Glycerophosphodiester phosphodiesterase family protein n=1 Tax=Sphingomonas corticis TaxID=2722791 RepID=A0ABX1CU70_9SPHN|nr:glycerophosphodiester phosphodiesterase family protein [Sphingomonas corticis]NJR79535.1 glycerophosphodiester phosphodiesterase family protein [Sphingomonas corticis]